MTNQGQLVKQPPAPVILEDYMLGELFKMVEEKEEEEVFYSCRMIIIDVVSKSTASKSCKTIAPGVTRSYLPII